MEHAQRDRALNGVLLVSHIKRQEREREMVGFVCERLRRNGVLVGRCRFTGSLVGGHG